MKVSKRALLSAGALMAAMAPLGALAQRRQERAGTSRDVALLAKDEAEQRAFAVLERIRRDQRHYNVGRDDGRLLRMLTAAVGAKHVVEIGTSTGYSGIWITLGLRASGGRLTTYEIDAGRAQTARENFGAAGVDDLVTVIVGDAHVEVGKLDGPIDLVFIDADKEGYPDYLRQLLPKLRTSGLVVADNMNFPEPDPRYVEAVTTNPALETLFLNMDRTGLGVTLKKG